MQGDTVFTLIMRAGPVVKFVLIVLLFFSVFSWAIIYNKFRLLSRVERESDEFQRNFQSSRDLDALYHSTRRLRLSPLASLFRAIHASEETDIDNIKRTLKRVEATEAAKLERYLTFLATTGSTTPFIGLFGTVWGIMNSFIGIGRIGSASLAVVAPGIAEALIATAAGLVAAIPAVVAYNYYISRTRRDIIVMEDFSQELVDYFMRKNVQEKTGTIRD